MPKKTEPEKPKARSGPWASAGKNPLKVIEETKIKATVRAEALSIDKMAVLAKALLGVAPGI